MNLPTQLSNGFIARNAEISDLPAAVNLLNAYSQHLVGTNMLRQRDLEPEWHMQDYRPETHIRLVFAPHNRLAGYMEFWDVNQPRVIMHAWGRVDPAFSDPAIMAHLLEWVETRARQSMESVPAELRVVLRAPVPSLDDTLCTQLQQMGYSPVRRFWRMLIDLPSEPAPAVFPAGIEVRTVHTGGRDVPPDVIRKALHALREAFTDHWGHVDIPFEEEFEHWMYNLKNDPEFDPSLWFFALEQGEIAGFSYCRRSISEDPNLGWVGQLGVLRPWRKHGLGLALLQHSFCALYQRGQRKVGLGVDASSLTGATRLYEKAGMHSDPQHITDVFEKELRPGRDLSTQAVESE